MIGFVKSSPLLLYVPMMCHTTWCGIVIHQTASDYDDYKDIHLGTIYTYVQYEPLHRKSNMFNRDVRCSKFFEMITLQMRNW